MRRPIKPFIVEVKRAGRASHQPTKDMWSTTDDPSPEPRQSHRDAERAFAAASRNAEVPGAAEPNRRVLVAQGYRSPLDLRLDQDEQERAGRRRAPPTKSPERTDTPVANATEKADLLQDVGSNGTTDGAVDASTPLKSKQVANGSTRGADDLPRHLRWTKRLRYRK